MLIRPSIDKLLTKVDSKYSLVVMAAKRAREIKDNAPMPDPEHQDKTTKRYLDKEVTLALQEINQGLISYRRTTPVND